MTMNVPMIAWARRASLLLLLIAACSSFAQETRPTTTRLLVTVSRLKPEMVDRWIALQQSEVVPALKKAGITERVVYQTLIGEATEFMSVRPLPSFAELDESDPLEQALGVAEAARLRAELRACELSTHRHIENRQDEFYLDPGDAEALFASRYRAMPGRAGDYMSFVRTEMFPVMRQAQEEGTFSGLSVTVSAQGGEAGIITLNMHYPVFAELDGPPPVAKTLGPEGTREFLAKGAGLITPIEQLVLRRVAELSF
jgi:hypothetical protein